MNNLKKVILDTDIGDDIDDSFALLLLLESHKFNCLGVTTVFRNSLKRAKMAKQLIRSLGYDIKVYRGIDDPLKQNIDHLISKEIKEKEKYDERDLDKLNFIDILIASIAPREPLTIPHISPMTSLHILAIVLEFFIK